MDLSIVSVLPIIRSKQFTGGTLVMNIKYLILSIIYFFILTACRINTAIESSVPEIIPGKTKFSIESNETGHGVEITSSFVVTVNSQIPLYAIARDATNKYITNVAVAWAKEGGSGSLNIIGDGKSAILDTGPNPATITVNLYYSSQLVKSIVFTVTLSPNVPVANVESVYPNNPNWNDYILNSDILNDKFHQSDVACDGSEKGKFDLCIHSGVLKKVVVAGESSCANLTLTESLSAFVWRCSIDTSTAVFYSYGLKPGKGLRDLIDSSGWKNNSVQIYKSSTLLVESAPEVWWTNPVVDLPNNDGTGVVTLTTPGAIYKYNGNKNTSGYNIDANKIAIIGLSENDILTYNDSAGANCSFLSGETTAADNHCLISIGSNQFSWLEVNLVGDSSVAAGSMDDIFTYDTRYTSILNSRISGAEGHGIHLKSSQYVLVNNVKESSVSSTGLRLDSSSFCKIENSEFNNNAGNGIYISGQYGVSALELLSVNNSVVKVTVSNNGGSGITHGCGQSYGVFSRITSFANGSSGIKTICGGNMSISHVTAVGNGGTGVSFDDYSYTNFLNSAILVNNNIGLDTWYSTNLTATNVALTNNVTYGYRVFTDNGSKFKETLLVGNNGSSSIDNCSTASLNNSGGIIIGNCTDSGADQSNTYTGLSSTALLRTGIDLTNSINGTVTTDDVSNSSDTNGFAAAVSDWFDFSNPYRVWGKDGNFYPAGGKFWKMYF